MTREIKFRGKRIDNKEWEIGALLQTDDGETYIATSFLADSEPNMPLTVEADEVDPDTVGQYTGLTDKNGNEIFEGDIVLKRTYNGKKPFPVTFDSGMFHCGYGGGSSTATHGYTLDDSQIEIIGNIHDNPELMGGN